SKSASSRASTTSVLAMRGTRASASSVCATIALPAIGTYCLGRLLAARDPLPAQGTRAWQRGAAVIASILKLPSHRPCALRRGVLLLCDAFRLFRFLHATAPLART